MPIVNVVKQTIKSKTHTALQKLLSLRLLNKCFLKDNKEFMRYTEKKILTRLGIFAQHNKEKNEESDIVFKGEMIFSGSEKDRRSAAAFLVLLLDCLERWAKLMPTSPDVKDKSEFAKTYTMLQQKKILFPSQCRMVNPFQELGLQEEMSQHPQQSQKKPTAGVSGAAGLGSRGKSEYQKSSSSGQPKPRVDAQKIAQDLKSRMMRAKDVAKKSEQFLQKMEAQGFQAEPVEFIQMDDHLTSGREHCEFCVESLMSEEIGPLIANKEELLDRMLKYQEQILTAIAIIAPFVESVKSQEDQAIKAYNQQKAQNRATAYQTSAPGLKSDPFGNNTNTFSTNQQQKSAGSSTLDILSSLFPSSNQPLQVDKNDPFAEAIMDLQNQPPQDDFFTGYQPSAAQQQPQADFNFDFPQQQTQAHYDQQQQQEQQYYQEQQQQHVKEQPHQPQQPEETKIHVGNGGDNYSIFKMMQEGLIDVEAEKASAKRKREQHSQQQQQQQHYQESAYDQQQQFGYDYGQQQQQYYGEQQTYSTGMHDYTHQHYVQNEPAPVYQEEEVNYTGVKLSDYAAAQGDQWQANKVKELEKQVKQLKQQNTDMITSNQLLKERYENLKQQYDYQQQQQTYNAAQVGNDYQSHQLQLQNQQLEMQINNMRDYYEREIENKDHLLTLKDQEIAALKAEVEALRSGKAPEEVPRALDVVSAKQQSALKQKEEAKSLPLPHESPLANQSPDRNHRSSELQQPKLIESEDVPHDEEQVQNHDQKEIYHPDVEGYDKKSDLLYLKGILSDKMLVYDDANVKIGCIRSVSVEWRQATLKLYLGNKSTDKAIEGIVFTKEHQFINIGDQDSQPFSVEPNDQLEVKIYVGAQVHSQPYVYFQYGIEEGGMRTKLKLPVNLMFFCEPFQITPSQFLQFWKFTKNHATMYFNMDLTRISNLQAVKKILTLNEKHGTFIQGIDAKPNIVGYSANHLEGQLFAMLEISPSGTGSLLQVKSEVSEEFSQSILKCLLDMLSSRQ